MSKIMTGVFLGVFTTALFYEVLTRQNPRLAEKIRHKLKNKFDRYLEPEVVTGN